MLFNYDATGFTDQIRYCLSKCYKAKATVQMCLLLQFVSIVLRNEEHQTFWTLSLKG